jgi:general L-amino acid transport system permease protein
MSTPSAKPSLSQTPPLWRDLRFLRAIGQIFFLVVVLLFFGWFIGNTQQGLKRAGLSLGFDFLDQPSSFQIDEGLTAQPHLRTDSFLHAFEVGLINTLRVIFIGLFLTTILGLLMGVARLSNNWLIQHIALVYVEIMQNTPLLVQLIFLYIGVLLTLPSVREAVVLPGPVYLSVRGLATPALVPTDNVAMWLVVVLFAVGVGSVVWRVRRRAWLRTGQPTYGAELGTAIVVLVAIIGWLFLTPFIVSLPRTVGPRYVENEGWILSPEFAAVLFGLVLYTGAFVAEIVRAGIQAVPIGQWEAARAQGFSHFQTLRLIVLPQALRVMIPPLTNQYLNLIKNSSLGAAVGYSEIFGVGKTIQLQSGASVQVIVIVMITYLALDLLAALIMNIVNARFQLKTQ